MPRTSSFSPFRLAFLTAAAVFFGFVAGCRPPEPAEFRLNLEGRKAEEIREREKEAIRETLKRLFGTPDSPRIPAGTMLDEGLLAHAAGPYVEKNGTSISGLFRRYCAECHGISGDGAGNRAGSLYPYPRDYRLGVFKYTSTHSGGKPSDADLARILENGAVGTAMPSFAELDSAVGRALLEYVKYLAIRGETEHYLVRLVIDENEYLPLDMRIVEEEGLFPVLSLWEMAPGMVVPPRSRLTRTTWVACPNRSPPGRVSISIRRRIAFVATRRTAPERGKKRNSLTIGTSRKRG